MPATSQRDRTLNTGTQVTTAESPLGSRAKAAFKRELAELSYAEQMDRVRPSSPEPNVQTRADGTGHSNEAGTAVQLMSDESGSDQTLGAGSEAGAVVQLVAAEQNPDSPVGAYERDRTGHQNPAAAPSRFEGKSPEDIVKKHKNWEAVKAEVLDEALGEDTEFMLRCCDYRKNHVLGIINQIKGTGHFPELGIIAPGSTSPTSDFDVTFTGSGAIQAVISFNKIFRGQRGWGLESGTVFDTNVYAENFIHSKPPNAGTEQLHPMADAEQQRDNYVQDVASLIKIRKNMTQSEFDTHQSKIVNGVKDAEVKAVTAQAYSEADQAYKTWIDTIYAELDEDIKHKLSDKSKEQVVMEALEVDEGMRAANRIYEQKLLAVQALIDERDRVAGDPAAEQRRSELNLQIRTAHSEALLYANEPYFSAGTITHVVGNLQAKFGYVLEAVQALQSFNENYGDVKKDFGHYAGQPFPHAVYRTSKYVFRYTDAGKTLKRASKSEIEPPKKNDELWIKSRLLVEIRGSTDPEEEKTRKAAEYARPYTDLSQIGAIADRINVDVNQQARNKKIGQ